MNSRFTLITLILLLASMNYAQTVLGLEGIIVEKYYISDENDAMASDGGTLPVGSVTYRIFVDMKPGFSLQGVFGDDKHTLKIATTTKFFNNTDRGQIFPTFPKTALRSNTVMLDSWLTMGGACKDHVGVLKSRDNGEGTVINSDGLLKNSASEIGILLTEQDGMIMKNPSPAQEVGFVNIDRLDATTEGPDGDSIYTSSGALFTPEGARGIDSTDNMVLIAQLTTNGVLSFNLNIQLGTPVPGVTQTYVFENPSANEFLETSLTYKSNTVSTKNENDNISIVVYPNPTSGDIYFNLGENAKAGTYQIFDLTGKLIKSNAFTSEKNQFIDMYEFPKGLYSIHFNTNGKVISHKIVKI
ncbi:MAG: hypothetical protein RLZZ546_2756 [Bacteroidota bacterium]|jgi:hypothetical protein